MPPFTIPPLTDSVSSLCEPQSPTRKAYTSEPMTPTGARTTGRSVTVSPSTTVSASSPTSNTPKVESVSVCRYTRELALKWMQAPHLRHPSRLRTHALTADTFRIYVKHYMDNAPLPRARSRNTQSRSMSPTPSPRPSKRPKLDQTTPTKASLRSGNSTLGTHRIVLSTECPTTANDAEPDDEELVEDDDQLFGYTLSHLRRVPELALLSRRVVRAETRRREKEERKKVRSQRRDPQPSTSAQTSRVVKDMAPAVAAKRLFIQAIRTLFAEGDIVLWNGPVRTLPVPPPSFSTDTPTSSSSASLLYGADTSTSSATTTATSVSSRYDEWDEDEPLSDPQPNEEAYVPLTSAYFSRVLEGAIRTIMTQAAAPPEDSYQTEDEDESGDATPRAIRRPRRAPQTGSLIERLRAQERSQGPPPGPTRQELLAWLRNSDERWARVGEQTVQEALEYGQRAGRLWCIGKGRWEVCE